MYHTVTVEFRGLLFGSIWMPNIECTKPILRRYNMPVERNASMLGFSDYRGSIRDTLIDLTNDGDFQNAKVADLTMFVTRYNPETHTKRVRSWTIRYTPDNADCLVEPESDDYYKALDCMSEGE
jgi:hypothetical protein